MAHLARERVWARGAYTVVEAVPDVVGGSEVCLTNTLHYRAINPDDPPPREAINVVFDKRTLQQTIEPKLQWVEGRTAPVFEVSDFGRVGFDVEGDQETIALHQGVCRTFGLDAEPRNGGWEEVLLSMPEPDENAGGILRRDIVDGRPVLTLHGDAIKFVSLHDASSVQNVPFPAEHEHALQEAMAEMMVSLRYSALTQLLFNFDDTYAFLTTVEMVLVIDRATGEVVCEIDLRGDSTNAYPAGLNYVWAEHGQDRAPSLQAMIGDATRWADVSQETIFRGAPK